MKSPLYPSKQSYVWLAPTIAFLVFLVVTILAFAQGQSMQPSFVHNACAGNCVADIVFLHSNQGDTQAENFYHAWFNEYFIHTGCGDSQTETGIKFLVDVIADSVGAPGAPTLQCWQGLGALGSLCNNTCSDYFHEDGAYAPNIRTSLLSEGQGFAQVKVDNTTNGAVHEGDPEGEPNAYSRKFTLYTFLKYGDNPKLLVYNQDMPSLSFPNWITRGGWDTCAQQYDADEIRCSMLAFFDTPSAVFSDPSFGNGALYDLSGLTSNGKHVGGSAENGYLRLAQDGAKVTIAQGPYTVYAYTWTHNKSKGTYSEKVSTYAASSGSVSFTNHECNSWYCGIVNDKIDRDTYIFILDGPEDRMLLGDYHIEVDARVAHDKDTSDNKVAYDYSVAGLPPTPAPTPTPIDFDAITPQDIGPGMHSGTLASSQEIDLYRLNVPPDTAFVGFELNGPVGTTFDLFTEYNQPPAQSYPRLNVWEYDCRSDTEWNNAYCSYTRPIAGNYYIAVIPYQGIGAYTLDVHIVPGATSTPTPSLTPTPADASGGTDTDDSGQGSGLTDGVLEQEPNNSYVQATQWDIDSPIQGRLDERSDEDIFVFTAPQSGIYKISLSNVAPNIAPDIYIKKESLAAATSDTSAEDGQSILLSMDANQGELYYIKVKASSGHDFSDQYYTLSMEVVPDPLEPNDSFAGATIWDYAAGPIQGYFAERVSGPGDYYQLTVPVTSSATSLTVALTDVPSNVAPEMFIYRSSHTRIASDLSDNEGESISLTFDIQPGDTYFVYVKPETRFMVSTQLYKLSVADYEEGSDAESEEAGEPSEQDGQQEAQTSTVSLSGVTYRGSGLIGLPLADVNIWVQIGDQIPQQVGSSNFLGLYMLTLQVPDQVSVQVWAEKDGYTFEPSSHTWPHGTRFELRVASFIGTQIPEQTGADSQPPTYGDNLISGRVYKAGGEGVPGVMIFVQAGTSDAIQVLGPTAADGTYQGEVQLPEGIQVKVWAEKEGMTFEPAYHQFFHQTSPENQQLDFLWVKGTHGDKIKQ